MDAVPFVLAAVSLTASIAVASWATGLRSAAALIGATVVSVATATISMATAALALLLLTTLIGARFPWRGTVRPRDRGRRGRAELARQNEVAASSANGLR